ncbi:MAG: HD-GYP domain-containing protein [Desulfovibrionaceae bacterium]
MAEGDPKVFPVSPLLFLPETVGEFAVYLRQGGRLVLYVNKQETFTRAHRDRLMDSGVERVFIASQDREGYDYYVQMNLGRLLSDESIPLEERVQAWRQASASIVKDVFQEKLPRPLSKKRFSDVLALVDATTDFFSNPESLRRIAKFINHGFSLYHHAIGVMVLTVSVLHACEGVSRREMVDACLGAMLHDMGKTRIPAPVLGKKPEHMSEEERGMIHSHPMMGAGMCLQMPVSKLTQDIVLFHHERHDGSGYPSGLLGEEAPLPVRVVSACNVYDSMTRNLPGRAAKRPYDALSTMNARREYYDPQVLRRLIMVLANAEIA